MTESPKIQFNVWLMVRADGVVQMLDTALPPDDDEERFGPYKVAIPTPRKILELLQERGQVVIGTIKDD